MSAILDHAGTEQIHQHLRELRTLQQWHQDQRSFDVAALVGWHIDRLLDLLLERDHADTRG